MIARPARSSGVLRNGFDGLREWRQGARWAEFTHRRRVAAQWMLAGPFVLAALLILMAAMSGICSTFGQQCSPEQQREIDFFGWAAGLVLLPGPIALFILRRRLSLLVWPALVVLFLVSRAV